VKRDPAPVVNLAPKTELKDNKQAMANMANKFADKDEEDDDDEDSSSFEEVHKPVERPVRAADPPKPTPAATPVTRAAPAAAAKPTPTPAPAAPAATVTTAPPPTVTPTPEPATSSSSSSASPAEALKTHLADIKSSLATTRGELAEIKAQMGDFGELVKALSTRMDTLVGSQAERIRRLELEVEGLRD
jgi:coronin-1B/1C/6